MFAFSEDRNAALRNWANGDRHCEAAVELLIDHGSWPERLDRAGLIEGWKSGLKRFARPELAKALVKLDDADDGDLYASGSELRVLWLAASLAAGVAINLSNALVSLDAGNQVRVARAICHALGGAATVDHRF